MKTRGYGICFQRFLLMMDPIIGLLTPYLSASTYWLSELARIAITASLVSFAFGLASPLGLTVRPLPLRSRLLSRMEPRNKWFGFTQSGTSHLCKTFFPTEDGHKPVARYMEIRCVIHCPPPAENTPYPYLDACERPAVQSQHSPLLSTRDQKRSTSDELILGNSLFGFAMVAM